MTLVKVLQYVFFNLLRKKMFLFLFELETAEFKGFDQINAYKKHIVDFSERKKS